MGKRLFHKIKGNKAFTLLEMLIVIAITVILTGVSVVAITSLSTSLKMTELDDHAKAIYLEAQNQLAVIEAEGALDAYYEKIRDAYPVEGQPTSNLRFLKEIYPNGEYVSDYPVAEPNAIEIWQNMCYLTREDALAAKLITHTSDVYRNGGSYLIEFNPKTGDIYGVFYWESDQEISYEDNILGKSRELAERKKVKMGYYGGVVAGLIEETKDFDKTVTLVNGEELYVKVSYVKTEEFIAADTDSFKIKVKVTASGDEVEIDPEKGVIKRVDEMSTVDYYILLDSMYEDYRFNDIINDGKTGAEQLITPGEDITVIVTTEYVDANGVMKSFEDSVTGNSLFGLETNADRICISHVRHMLNLNESIYKAGAFATRNEIQYISDVDFAEDAYSWELGGDGKPVYRGYGQAVHPINVITPIQNNVLFSNRVLTGKFASVKYVLRNFVVQPEGESSNVAIFSSADKVKISNIYVENVTVNAPGCENVGALVGYMKDGELVDCGAYLSTQGMVSGVMTEYCKMADSVSGCTHSDEMQHRYDTYKIVGKNNVGGLVGHVEATQTVKIENSFAAVKVEGADSYIGGLVGYANVQDSAVKLEIKHSYASGDVDGKNYVGGFVGGIDGVNGQRSKTRVHDTYATGYVSAIAKFGGFVGQSKHAEYSQCISYGKVQRLVVNAGDRVVLQAADLVGGFVCDNPDTNLDSVYTDCTYMAQIGYNRGSALKDPASGITKKEYSLLVTSDTNLIVDASYAYDEDLFVQVFPFKKLANQSIHYGNWPKQFVIDTSLVYYERYADNSYGYYCVTTVADNDNIWLLDTLRDEACVEDGYGLLTRYNLSEISYDLYIGNKSVDSAGNSLHLDGTGQVLDRDAVSQDDASIQGAFLRLNQQGTLRFKEIESYDAVLGVEGAETGDIFELSGLYLYQLPYELQCTDRRGVDYFYDRIVLSATGYGTNKQVIKDVPFLYCPHFAKTAFNPNVSDKTLDLEAVAQPVEKPHNVFVRSARQLNSLGRFSYYWNTRHGLQDKVNYIQETDINFSTYTKKYAGHDFDLQDLEADYRNRPIGNSDYGFLGETGYAGPFKNSYDGQCYKIIDFCLDVSDIQFVGLFGEIQDATLKNIVMVVSSNPASENAGLITSDYKTWMTVGDTSRRREMRASVAALLGMAYDNSYCDVASNTIENCAAAGYTVEFVVQGNPNPHKPSGSKDLDPLGIVIGGLIGYGESDIKNCSAVNDVVIRLEKDYTNSFSYWRFDTSKNKYVEDTNANEGGIVNMGGFVGSYLYSKIENCYSGGTITVIDNGYEIPHLRVGNFCAGWLDTRAYGLDYTDWKKIENNQRICSCGNWCSNSSDYKSFEYVNCYTYTTVSDSIWGVSTKTMSYVPFASRKVDFFHRGTNSGYWTIADKLPNKYTTFDNTFYLDTAVNTSGTIDANDRPGTSITNEQLKNLVSQEGYNAVTVTQGNTHTYKNGDVDSNGNLITATEAYPYPAVVKDKAGNYVHYGDWPEKLDSSVAYYEKYADGSYGYYCVMTDETGTKTWILDTLKDQTCIEDGYGILTQYELDNLKYKLWPFEDLINCPLDKYTVEGTLKISEYRRFNDIIGKGEELLDDNISVSNAFKYFYKLPYDLHFIGRQENNVFYDRIRFTATSGGDVVMDDDLAWFNPHFAKAALNLTPAWYDTIRRPENVYVRSARQLNALGRYEYYWKLTGGIDWNQKVTYVQETDINFSTYVKEYLGHEFDLQKFGTGYANRPIGTGGGKAFTNNYDGRSNLIIDYCVDGGSKTRYTGLFGEIQGATLKNIVMVVSSSPNGKKGGWITTAFRPTQSDGKASVGLGALLGSAFQNDSLIENCSASGYTVQYVLKNDVNLDPASVAVGGLVGFSMSEISNCTAVNDVVMKLEKDYTEVNPLEIASREGVVYLGGLVGSQMYKPVTNSYSGGTINVLNKDGANEYRIPYLRVGGLCPGWMDLELDAVYSYEKYITDATTNKIVEYKNVYSYTHILNSVWDVDSKSMIYVPLVSNLVDYRTLGNWMTASESKIRFDKATNAYLDGRSFLYLQKTSNASKVYYMKDGNDFTATQKNHLALQMDAVNGTAVTISGNNTNTYQNGDVDATGKLIYSTEPYPYPAVIYQVDEDGNPTDTYVHYGKWLTGPTDDSPISRYPVYFEEHQDGYGFWYLDETGAVHNSLTVVNDIEIKNAGYGYLTLFESEANADTEKATIMIDGKKYYLYMMDASELNAGFVNSGRQNNRYMTFEMTYSRGETTVGPGSELVVETKTIYFNPYYGAALSMDSNLGKDMSNPNCLLQVRTKEQFENIRYTTEAAYIKQTHDVDLKYGNRPTTVYNSVIFDGSFSDEGCVIKNAADALFLRNRGEIKNVRVASFDGTKASYDLVAGFVLQNDNIIRDCSVAPVDNDDKIIIHGTKVSGFVETNRGPIDNCHFVGEIEATEVASGFVGVNAAAIGNCTVDMTGETITTIKGNGAFGFAEKNYAPISNCHVKANVIATGESTWNYGNEDKWQPAGLAAGFVGMNTAAIANSYVHIPNNDANAAIEGHNASGFAMLNGYYGSIANCYVTGTESGIVNGSIKADMVSVGFMQRNDGKIFDCYVRGENSYEDMVVQGCHAFGFVYSNNNEIKNSYVVGTVKASEHAAGFVGSNNVTIKVDINNASENRGISYCYANANVSTSTDAKEEAKAAGFAYWSGGKDPWDAGGEIHVIWIENCYASGTVSGYNTSGFAYSAYARNCYSIVDQAGGINRHPWLEYAVDPEVQLSASNNNYWGYDGYRLHNVEVGKTSLKPAQTPGALYGKELATLDNAAEDTDAFPFSEKLKDEKYPYETFGLTHYGDWPKATHFHTQFAGSDWLRAGVYYGEQYVNAVTGQVYRGVYAIGDYFYRPDPTKLGEGFRAIGATVNNLAKGTLEEVRELNGYRCYYGVYYNKEISASNWKVNWQFVEDGVASQITSPQPYGKYGNLGVGYVPPAFNTYSFNEIKDITQKVLLKDVTQAEFLSKNSISATVYYVTSTNNNANADTNYDDGKFYYEDGTKVNTTNGVKLTITLADVENARAKGFERKPINIKK